MKIQIIYCHPSTDSYTFEILARLKATLEREGLEYEISDLYKMKFQTDMTEKEYQREGFARTELALSEDVKIEQQKIEKADCLIFLYPVWWSDCPAKLKGWFDRVYSLGYAYGYGDSKESERMKLLQYGLVLCTAGHPNDFLKKIGIAGSMQNVMLDDRLGKRFVNKEMIILGGTLDKEKARPKHYDIIDSIGIKIKENAF